MGLGGTGLEGLTSSSGGGGVPDSPLLLQNFGVVTDPELAFDGDRDTGLYRPAGNELGLVAGAQEQLRITGFGSAFLRAGSDPAGDGGDLDLSSGDSGTGAVGVGGDVNILAGSSVATTGDGGIVSIKSGDGFFNGAGGDILVEVGEGGAAGPGTSGNFFLNTTVGLTADAGLLVPVPGLVSMYGVGRTGEGPAGDFEIWGGYANGTGGGSIGGDLLLFGGGQGGGAGEGGNAHIYGGESDTQPGFAEVEGGTATVGGPGGSAFVRGGPGFGTNFGGGLVLVAGGLGIGTGNGGQANLIGGGSGSGATGDGGNVEVVGGPSNATNGDGGDAVIESGAGNGGGVDGDILLKLGAATQFRVSPVGIHAVNAAGPAMLNEAASATNPTLIPNRANLAAGVGASASGAVNLIANGVEGIRVTEGEGSIASGFAGRFEGLNVSGSAAIRDIAASATVPTLHPNKTNLTMGIGAAGSSEMNFIVDGVSCMSVAEDSGARQIGFYTTSPISLQTGVSVTDVAIHAALVALGLITA